MTTISLEESCWRKGCYFAAICIHNALSNNCVLVLGQPTVFSGIFWSRLGSLVPGKGQSTSDLASSLDIVELWCIVCILHCALSALWCIVESWCTKLNVPLNTSVPDHWFETVSVG